MVDLKRDHVEGEDDAEADFEKLLGVINRHERRSQPNIKSPLEMNLETEAEPKMVFVGAKLDRELKNQLIALVNEYLMFSPGPMQTSRVSTPTL